MTAILKLLAGIVVSIWCAAVVAQGPPPAIASSATSVAQAELAVAKAELEVTRKYQEHLLATVYWALGTLAAVAALLVGYSWWNNSRNYDRDRIAFEREAGARLTEMVAKIAAEQQAALHLRTEGLEQKLTRQTRESEEKLLGSMGTKLDESKKGIADQLKQLKASLSEVRSEINKIHFSAQLQRHQRTRASGIRRNALQDSVTALEMALKLDDEYEIGNVLDLVANDVNFILNGKDLPIDNFLIGQLVGALDRVKGSHAHAAAAIKTKAPSMLSK